MATRGLARDIPPSARGLRSHRGCLSGGSKLGARPHDSNRWLALGCPIVRQAPRGRAFSVGGWPRSVRGARWCRRRDRRSDKGRVKRRRPTRPGTTNGSGTSLPPHRLQPVHQTSDRARGCGNRMFASAGLASIASPCYSATGAPVSAARRSAATVRACPSASARPRIVDGTPATAWANASSSRR